MTSWAIVVGINDYGGDDLKTLHGAVADAADFADWLLDQDGGAVEPQHLFLWTYPRPTEEEMTPRVRQYLENPTKWIPVGPNFDKAPGVAELVGGISKINAAAVADNADRLYVFLAGHGAQTKAQSVGEDPQNCFVTGDYNKYVENAGLVSCDDMRRYLQLQGPSETLIFLDCCRNELPRKVMRPGTAFANLASNGTNQRMVHGRAAIDGAIAYEVPFGPAARRGAFTQLLTYGLREERHGGHLTLKKLDEYVTEALREVVKAPRSQVPDFEERPKPPALVLVTGPAAGRPADVTFVLSAGSEIQLLDDDEQVIRTFPPEGGRFTEPLHRGAYSLERSGATLVAFNHVGPGTPDVTA